MTTKLEQAARQIIVDWDSGIHLHETITALREALAEQAEQEPAPWKHDCAALCANGIELWIDNCPHCGKPRTAPSEPVKQEPVAWAISHSLGLEFGSKYPMQETKEAADQMARQHMGAVVVTPLYAAPVSTKDLTDEELWEAAKTAKSNDLTDAFRAVIAADRELNK